MIDIKNNVNLAQFTSFKVGGPALFFVEAKNKEEILESLEYAKENNLDIFILGGGSNVLISDQGFNGLVIRVKNEECKIFKENMKCGAGISLAQAVKESVDNGLTGLEWAAGIPGTFGGAVRGNAGAFDGSMQESIEKVTALDIEEGKVKEIPNNECRFSYRNSIFKQDKKFIIISATLSLEKGDAKRSQEKVQEVIAKRKNKQPQSPSAGSFFKNPRIDLERDKELVGKFERDMEMKIKGDKIPAGWFIDQVDLRGKKIGGAQVSEKHANFIINTGNAKAEDVIILSSLIKQKVRTKFGIQLEPEVQFVGF